MPAGTSATVPAPDSTAPSGPVPRVAVFGAGAVGAWFGGLLARAGVPVTLVARPAHVEAIRRDGLRLQSAAFDEHVRVQASTEASAIAGADLVLCCVKSPDTEAAADAMAPHLATGAWVWSLQNGVDNAARLQARLAAARPGLATVPVWPAVVYVAAGMAGPGHVHHHGRGELVVGPLPGGTLAPAGTRVDVATWVATFARAGVRVDVSDQVVVALWRKLVVNCAYNGLSALTRLPYGELVRRAGMPAVMRDIVEECVGVARAQGVALPDDVHGDVDRIAATMAGQRSSTAQDLLAGKPTEIDHLNGLVVREGERLGLPTPANRTVWALVRAAEGR